MKEIKRYDVVLVDGVPGHRPSESGRWVKHEDHAALQEQVRTVNALITEFWLTRHLVTDYVATPYMTDALNKIRAEGVCILTGKIQQLIDEGTFDAKEIGVAAGVVYEGAQIAYKLRAGEQP